MWHRNDELQNTVNAFYKSGQSPTAAAELLGVPRSTFSGRLKKALDMGFKPKIRVQAGREVEKKISRGMKERSLRGVYFTDAHNQPCLDLERFEWLAGLVNDLEPDLLVDGGDFDDLGALCSHERNDTWRGRFKPSVQADLEASQRAHDLLSEKIKVKVTKYRTLGNHEHRIFLHEDRNPEIYGILRDTYLNILTSHGWEYAMYGEYLDIAGVDFVHAPLNRMSRPSGGKRVCSNIARDSVKDVVFGHTHEKNIHTETKFGPDRSVTAINGGCFMPEGYVPDYAKNTQVNYWRGCFLFQIEREKIRILREYTLEDLKAGYGG